VRIGFVNTEARSGGATRAMRRTMNALVDAGHEVVLVTLAEPGDDGIPTVRIMDQTPRGRGRVAGVAHYFYNGRYIDRNRTDISNTLFWAPAVGLDIAGAVGRLGLDVLNIHWSSYFLSVKSLESLMALPIPVVFTLHDMAYFTGGCHYSAGCRGFETTCSPCPQLRSDPLKVPRDVLRRRREVYEAPRPWAIAPSRWMAEAASASGLFPADRCIAIPNALDLEMFSPRSRSSARRAFGLPQEARVILFGAFDNRERRKGYDLLVEAMRRFMADDGASDDPPLVLGVGAHLPDLPIEGLRVVETGFIDDDARLALAYGASDAVVLASREDNLPNVMVEALACGTPVVGFDIGGIGETIAEGANGALAEPFDPSSLAAAIRRVLDQSAPDSAMRREARRSAQHLASPHVHARRCIEVFNQARDHAGFMLPEGLAPHAMGWRPGSPQGSAAMTEFFGGWPAEALIRARAMMK
jgi:glycosyltransferase involved in cell wall biosynthesis